MEKNTNGIIIIAALLGIYIFRIIFNIFRGGNYKYLLISFYISTVALNYSLNFMEMKYYDMTGVVGLAVGVQPYMLMMVVYAIFFAKRGIKPNISIIYFGVILLLFLISFFNPGNLARSSSLLSMFYLSSFILFTFVTVRVNTLKEVFDGLWDGFMFVGLINAALVICYPILGMVKVTTIFKGDSVILRSGREGGVGTFVHPNALATYITYCFIFFFSCYFLKYKKFQSFMMCLLSFFVMLTTFSRIPLLALIIIAFFLFSIATNKDKPIITFGLVVKVLLPAAITIVGLIYLTPLSKVFLTSNFIDMANARKAHWKIGWDIFRSNPIFGVGFNSHIEYIRRHFGGFTFEGISKDFMVTNPIHNIFFIMASETGIIGFGIFSWFILQQIISSKKALKLPALDKRFYILQLTSIGLIMSICLDGFSDWAPLNPQMLHIWLFIVIVALCCRSDNTFKVKSVTTQISK